MQHETLEQALERAATLVAQADALVITAGAGMGVDSGLPDFRGNDGFWKAYPALAKANMDFPSVASPQTFEDNPRLAWGFYGHRLQLYRNTKPHAGFALLKHWGENMPQGYTVFTSNVDGQFQKAGFDPQQIHECHGSIHHLQCLLPCLTDVWSAAELLPAVDEANCLLTNDIPVCLHCGGTARPNILMFGDWSWVERRQTLQNLRQEAWLSRAMRPLVIELGAGKAIPSVRSFGRRVIQQCDGQRIRINPRESSVDHDRDVGLAMGAWEGLQAIASILGHEWQIP